MAESNIPKIQAQFDQAVWEIQIDAWIGHQKSQLALRGFKPEGVDDTTHLDDVSYLAGRLHQLEEMRILLNTKKEIEVI